MKGTVGKASAWYRLWQWFFFFVWYINIFKDYFCTDTSRHAELGASSVQAEEEKEYAEKIQLLKQKLSNNASAMPNVLKRMKDCISRIDKLDSYNGDVHPAFKRKRSR